jgi:hypothetical protein
VELEFDDYSLLLSNELGILSSLLWLLLLSEEFEFDDELSSDSFPDDEFDLESELDKLFFI